MMNNRSGKRAIAPIAVLVLFAVALAFILTLFQDRLPAGIINAIGLFATVVSIVLAVYSIWYTVKVNTQTEDVLSQIKEQNAALVDRIHADACNHNYDEVNLDDVKSRGHRRPSDKSEKTAKPSVFD